MNDPALQNHLRPVQVQKEFDSLLFVGATFFIFRAATKKQFPVLGGIVREAALNDRDFGAEITELRRWN
jgi:hypothetical protein